LIYTKQFSLTATSTPFKISIQPNVNLPYLGQYVFGLSSYHNGIQLYSGNTGLTMWNDTVNGYNPITLTTIGTPQAKALCFYSLIALPSIVTTVSGKGGASSTVTIASTTITSISTSYIYTLTGSTGAVALVQDITNYLPIWLFPLLLGAWFGLTGLFMGMIIGVGLGTAFGIVPIWLAFLISLGLLYLMSKLH
jgi:hypothetical protein